MSDSQRPIPPNPPRWKPNPDPVSIIVPGLDTNASVLDQIEQMEQLITIKLQNIDENFSKIHNVLANKLLPAVKRYAVGTEPVREAAKFWTSFYEQAAQIRIPTYEDYSTVNEMPSEREEADTTATTETKSDSSDVTQSPQQDYGPSIANTDSSFLPGQAAYSSTPATARVAHSFASHDSDDPSWTASMESPLVRLNREIQNLSSQDYESFAPPSSKAPSMRYEEPTLNTTQQDDSILPRSEKGKGKEPSQLLLRNVLRHNLYTSDDVLSPGASSKSISPLKYRGKPKTPVPKTLNPYLSADVNPDDWSGVVDLRDPAVHTPRRTRSVKRTSPRKAITPAAEEEDGDDSFDGLPAGMSPPVLMSPARPPRSSAELGLLRPTPMREASGRISRDLVRDIQMKSGGQARHLYGYPNSGMESSMSTVPTPPSLSRYQRYATDSSDSMAVDPSLESMIERVGLNIPSTSGLASTPGLRLRPRTARAEHAATDLATPPQEPSWVTPSDMATPVYALHDDDDDSDSDSMDEINTTAHPSAAFLMASQGNRSDDSFGSSNHSSDSLADEDANNANLGIAPVHPFAGGVEDDGFDDDDSFDDDIAIPQEETVFGVNPAQRLRAQAAAGQGGHLRMLGQDLLQDTIGMEARLEGLPSVLHGSRETPTPWGANLRG